MLFVHGDLFAVVGLLAFDLVVKLNHKKESATVPPDIVGIQQVFIDEVLTDAGMLLYLEGGVGLKTKRVKQLEYATFDDYAHAEIVLDQYQVGVEKTRTAEFGSFVKNLLYLMICLGQSIKVAMSDNEVEVLFNISDFAWWLKNAYDLFA